jgi:hypothetical protein
MPLDAEVVVNKDFEGPSILELTDIIPGVEDAVRVDWSNSRDEIATILRFPGKKLILYVRDFAARDRTVSSLGLPLRIEEPVVARAWSALAYPKEYDWRNFCKQNEHGPSTRNILLKLAADSLRKGNRPFIADLIEPLFLDGVNIVDVDVLLRLKGRQR